MESKVLYTAVKIENGELLEKYPLTVDEQFCQPIVTLKKEDDGSLKEYTVIAWDKSKTTAKEMNEIITKGGECFDDANDYIQWRDKNPIKYDEKGNPISDKSIIDTIINLIGI